MKTFGQTFRNFQEETSGEEIQSELNPKSVLVLGVVMTLELYRFSQANLLRSENLYLQQRMVVSYTLQDLGRVFSAQIL